MQGEQEDRTQADVRAGRLPRHLATAVNEGWTFAAHGSLTVEGGKSPTGTAHGDLDGALDWMAGGVIGFPQHVDVPTLVGSLSNGANVLLINARVSFWFSNHARVAADAAIVTLADVSISEDALFKSFDIQVGGLDAIAGVSPIKGTTFPREGAAGVWSAELNSAFEQKWSDTEATMTLRTTDRFARSIPTPSAWALAPCWGANWRPRCLCANWWTSGSTQFVASSRSRRVDRKRSRI
ncbi:MAG TPA: hypothetical protein VF960_04645 [Chloroflexota bacterium]